MSGLGVHVNQSPTGIGAFLQDTDEAGSVVPALFALDINIAPDVDSKSPDTLIIFRTQQFGPDNGNMYVGDPVAAGRARVDQCYPIWQRNPAQFYAADNEPGRSDVAGLTWLCDYYLGEMQRADELGIKLCVGEWSTGMPPISAAESKNIVDWLYDQPAYYEAVKESVNYKGNRLQKMLVNLDGYHSAVCNDRFDGISTDYIAIYTPMLRYAAQHGHLLGLHEYSLSGPMIGSPLCLRYRTLLDALPADARPKVMIGEAGPGAGYATGYVMQDYINVVAAYDAELMSDVAAGRVVGCALFKLGKGESNMAEVMPMLTQYVVDHPTPPAPQNEREFDHWENADTGEVISTQNPYHHTVTRNIRVIAVTRPKVTPVNEILETDGHGTVHGGGSFAMGSVNVWEWRP